MAPPKAKLYAPGDIILGPDLYVVKLLGTGGQAEVYLAWSDFAQARRVIKLLNPDHLGQEGEKLFRKEVRLMVRLVHPHIVRVLDGQWTREDVPRPYYVMDEEPGSVPLAELIAKKTPFSLTQILRIIYEVADALDYVHGLTDDNGEPLGAVHRDIKPGNLLLVRSGNGSIVKLLDFGIARALKRALEGQRERMFLGTFAYSAPEQVDGNAVPQSDIYSLGVVFYELLAGRHPFWDAQDLQDMIACQRFITPRPISMYRANVPDRVTELAMRCLQKDPAKRPVSARVLRDELRRCMEEAAVLARREREKAVSDHDTTDEMPVEKLLDQRRAQLDADLHKTVAIIEERTGAGVSASWFQTDPGGPPVPREAPTVVKGAKPYEPAPSFEAWRAPTEPSAAPPPRAPAAEPSAGSPARRSPEPSPGPIDASGPNAFATRASAAAYQSPDRRSPTPTPAPTNGARTSAAPLPVGTPLAVPPVHAGQTDPDPPRSEHEVRQAPAGPTPSQVSRFRSAETQQADVAPPPTERLDHRGGTVPFGPVIVLPPASKAKGGKGGTVPMAPGFGKPERAATTSMTIGKAVIVLVGVAFLMLTVGLLISKQRHAAASEPAPASSTGAASPPAVLESAPSPAAPAPSSIASASAPGSAGPALPVNASPAATAVASASTPAPKPTTPTSKSARPIKPRGESPSVGP